MTGKAGGGLGENLISQEQELLVTLDSKFGIKSALNKVRSSSGTVKIRIRISIKNMDKLIRWVIPYFIA